jgi:CheY-like chemotaxis protein
VLAIDDDPAARHLVVEALRPAGFEVSAAASGREGIAMALEDPPELVICDLVMPDIDGYEVVDQLRANPKTQDATILILTGQNLTSADRERLNGKVAGVLGKDGDPRSALAKWLDRAAASHRRSLGLDGATAPSS